MSFLPDNYETPRSPSPYMKLQDGENKIRILSAPILGWEDWKDNKPIRFRMADKPALPVDMKKPIRHFWAFIVWSYAEQQVKILQLTQKRVQEAIKNLSKDEEWGSPYTYDIKITRTGKNLECEYGVNPIPHKPVSDAIKKAFFERRCNLDALFDGLDPFDAKWPTHTAPGFKYEIDEVV